MENFSALLTYLQDPETPFGVLDPIYTLYLSYGLILGLFRGLPEEFAHLAGTILIAIGAHMFYQPVSTVMIEHTRLDSEEASLALAYVLMILLFFTLWRLLILVIKKALDWTCPRLLYRPGGAILGLAKCVLVVGVILTGVHLSGNQVLTDHLITQSWIGRTIGETVPQKVEPYLPDWVPSPTAPSEEPPEPPVETEDGSGDT